MKKLYFFVYLVFIKISGIYNNNEVWMKDIEYDGPILKINENSLKEILKSVSHSLILFYDDESKILEEILTEFKDAGKELVHFSPPIGLFKMKCSENRNLCSDFTSQQLPLIFFISQHKSGIYEGPKTSKDLIKLGEKIAKSFLVNNIEDLNSLNDFIQTKDMIRVLGIYPGNSTFTEEEITLKQKFSLSKMHEDLFHKAIRREMFSNSGEFLFGKIIDFDLVKKLNKDINSSGILFIRKENSVSFHNFLKNIKDDDINDLELKFDYIKQFTRKSEFYLNLSEKTNIFDLSNDLLLNSLPTILPLHQNYLKFIFEGHIKNQFLLIVHPNSNNHGIFENYHKISEKFRGKSYPIWFTFTMFDDSLHESIKKDLIIMKKNSEKDFPVLMYLIHKENENELIEKYLYNREIKFEGLESFFKRFYKSENYDFNKNNIKSEEIITEEKQGESLIPKVVGFNYRELVFDFEKNVLVLFYNSEEENINLVNKWLYLLNIIKNKSNKELLRIYKFNTDLNDVFISRIPKITPSLLLFREGSKDLPKEYREGTSLFNLVHYLNQEIPQLELTITVEENNEFKQKIFIDPKYTENEDDLLEDDQEDGLNLDLNYLSNFNKEFVNSDVGLKNEF